MEKSKEFYQKNSRFFFERRKLPSENILLANLNVYQKDCNLIRNFRVSSEKSSVSKRKIGSFIRIIKTKKKDLKEKFSPNFKKFQKKNFVKKTNFY